MTAIARSPAPHVVIVGGGGTGGALALDLVLRGLRVTQRGQSPPLRECRGAGAGVSRWRRDAGSGTATMRG